MLLNSVGKFLCNYTWKITQNIAKEYSLKETRNSFKKINFEPLMDLKQNQYVSYKNIQLLFL